MFLPLHWRQRQNPQSIALVNKLSYGIKIWNCFFCDCTLGNGLILVFTGITSACFTVILKLKSHLGGSGRTRSDLESVKKEDFWTFLDQRSRPSITSHQPPITRQNYLLLILSPPVSSPTRTPPSCPKHGCHESTNIRLDLNHLLHQLGRFHIFSGLQLT